MNTAKKKQNEMRMNEIKIKLDWNSIPYIFWDISLPFTYISRKNILALGEKFTENFAKQKNTTS